MIVNLIYAAGLFGVVYWLYNVFHSLFISPLRKIPGPLSHQLFPFLYSYQFLIGNNFKQTFELHLKYGKVVRIGWHKVSFISQEATNTIYSSYKFDKSIFYDAFNGIGETIFSTRDKKFHLQRKRMLSPAFSTSSLAAIEPIVQSFLQDNLLPKLRQFIKEGNGDLELISYLNAFAMDVTGKLAFGFDFGTLSNGLNSSEVVNWIKRNQIATAIRAVAPNLGKKIDCKSEELLKFGTHCVEKVRLDPNSPTILNHLMQYGKSSTIEEPLSDKELAQEAIVQIIAGTDTLTNAMTWTIYLLLKNPEPLNKLTKMLHSIFKRGDEVRYQDVKDKVPYLTAILLESLRLFPPVASTVERVVPKGGATIEGYYLPAEVRVGVNLYTLHRHPELWDKPEEFLPSRWIQTDPSDCLSIRKLPNYSPFLQGPRACLGKQLAMIQLHLMIANLILNFDMTLIDPKLVLIPKNFVVLQPSINNLSVHFIIKP